MSDSSKKALAQIVLALAVVGSGMSWYFFSRKTGTRPVVDFVAPEPVDLKASAPELMNKIEGQLARLRKESMEQSAARLLDVNLFYWPGPPASSGSVVSAYVPLPESAGQSDLDAIMSNRRFRKLLDQLTDADRATAGQLINAELAATLPAYEELYGTELKRSAPLYDVTKLAPDAPLAGPTFVIENVPEDQATISGLRLKILSLVWAAGLLHLQECRESVEQVAHLAIRQRDGLYDDSVLHPFFKGEMLKLASLYNRQILVSALVSLARDDGVERGVLSETGASWQKKKLASYDAEVTEFDLPVQSGVAEPDYSRGSLEVRYLSPLTDANFDRAAVKLRLAP